MHKNGNTPHRVAIHVEVQVCDAYNGDTPHEVPFLQEIAI